MNDLSIMNRYQYAANWTLLHYKRMISPKKSSLMFVRRKKWRRVMVINFDRSRRRLPYELRAIIAIKSLQSIASSSSTPLSSSQPSSSSSSSHNWSSAYVEIYVNDVIHSNAAIAPPTAAKEFHIPFPYIDRSKEITVTFSRLTGGLLVGNNNKTSLKIQLGQIKHVSNPHSHLTQSLLYEDKSILVTIDWKIIENVLFQVLNVETCLSKGQLSELVQSEEKLSQHLKQKIIMLSLGLNSNCHGLIKEITNILSEAHPYLTDLDIMEILDDVNSVQRKNEFEKVIALLRDAESQQKVHAIAYPKGIPWYPSYLSMQLVYEDTHWSNNNNHHNYHHNNNHNKAFIPRVSLQREMIINYQWIYYWHYQQPVGLIEKIHPYLSTWNERANRTSTNTTSNTTSSSSSNSSNSSANVSVRQRVTSTSYSVRLLLTNGDVQDVLFTTNNLRIYYTFLRILSMIKYYHSGVYDKQTILDLQYPTIVMTLAEEFQGLIVEIKADFYMECLDLLAIEDDAINVSSHQKALEELLPIRVPFEYVSFVIYYSYYYMI
jgi:hypothetical protein